MASATIGMDNSGNERILVSTNYREKSLIMQIPGAKYDAEIGMWKLPVSYVACTQLSAVFGKSITVSDDIRSYAQDEYNHATVLAAKKLTPYDEWDVRGGTLLPLQVQGVKFMQSAHSTILADEMGSGKTVQVCALLETQPASRTSHSIVICPKSVKRSWEKHVEQWTSLTPHVIEGGAETRRKQILAAKEEPGSVLIMNWEQLVSHSRLKGYGNIRLSDKEREMKELNDFNFHYIIADEAHRAKSPKTKWTRALWYLNGENRIAITGTPIANHPGDFWSLLHFVDPVEWPSRGAYIDRYCVQQFSPWGGTIISGINHSRRQEFYHLIDRYFIRRTKEEVMDKKIDIRPEVRVVQLPPKHRKMYNAMRDDLVARIETGIVSATNPLTATSRLVQLCGAPLKEIDRDAEGNQQYEMVDPSPKVAELMDILDDLSGEPVIVFSSSKQLLYLAHAAIEKWNDKHPDNERRCSVVTGDVTGTERDIEIDRFQSGQTSVFLGTTAAAGEGVTLTAARYMVFLQRPWSLVQNLQAEFRFNRIGQEADSITIIDIIAEDTVDERIYEVFGAKTMTLDEITRDSLKEML